MERVDRRQLPRTRHGIQDGPPRSDPRNVSKKIDIMTSTRRPILKAFGATPIALAGRAGTAAKRPEIALYYCPTYHPDPRFEGMHGKGWTEWELVKVARPRFPGHKQPKMPVWGYEDESDPKAFEKKITAAADHGI